MNSYLKKITFGEVKIIYNKTAYNDYIKNILNIILKY